MKRWFLSSIALLTVCMTGLGISRVIAQDKREDDHAMMMKMMANRPKALKQADKTVMAARHTAMKGGMYNCCLKHPCDWCALKMGSCPCGKMAAMDKPVCNECKGGWAAGDGAVAGKTADDIKTFPRMDMKMDGMKMGHKMSMTSPAGVKLVDVWTCPMTGEKIADHKGVGDAVTVGNYRAHFCCPGCPASFAKLSDADKKAKVEEAAKKDAAN